MKYKSKVAAVALVAMTNTTQAMTAVEVIEYLNNDRCITEAYHVKPLINNPRGYTFLMRAEHWKLTFGHDFQSRNAYSDFEIKCSSDVAHSWVPNYVPGIYMRPMPPVPHIRVPRTAVPRTAVPRIPVPRTAVPRGYSHGDISSKGGDFRDNPNYRDNDTHSKYKKNVR